ncbi:hypothetical protein XENOCAPTIV_020019 [Xenoophorus captivus]|uniref:Chondroitin sulfate proteoglycan 4 n=1 Tax=Xenoophorus captivus TaxID=1517983 RepID=A0ABV0R5N3_9TELE
MAQDPYLQVENNTGLMVQQSGIAALTSVNLSVISNLDIRDPQEVTFEVYVPPRHGVLCFNDGEKEAIIGTDAISVFTQRDLVAGRLAYHHSGGHELLDVFNVTARARERSTERLTERGRREVHLDIGVPVKIYLESHHRPPTVKTNRPVVVAEGQNTPISREDVESRQLVFVHSGKHTDLFAVSVSKHGSDVKDWFIYPVLSHLQVNDGLILYDQNKPESVGWSAADSFSFTVSSPPAFLPPHTFTILISYQANEHLGIPQHRTKLLNNAVVAEGGRVTIDRSKLDASNLLGNLPQSHRKDHHIMYRVISLPRHGALTIHGHNLTRSQPDFSQATLNKFGIMYLHDDSETTKDSFTFRAWVAPLHLSSSSLSLSAFSSDSSSSSSFSPLYSASSSSFPALGTASHRHPVMDGVAVTEMFNITVTPVNDHPPLIRSRAPSMKVVVGETVILGPDNLQVGQCFMIVLIFMNWIFQSDTEKKVSVTCLICLRIAN